MDLTGSRECRRPDMSSLNVVASLPIRRNKIVLIALLHREAHRSKEPA
jgi:hypothetical protein